MIRIGPVTVLVLGVILSLWFSPAMAAWWKIRMGDLGFYAVAETVQMGDLRFYAMVETAGALAEYDMEASGGNVRVDAEGEMPGLETVFRPGVVWRDRFAVEPYLRLFLAHGDVERTVRTAFFSQEDRTERDLGVIEAGVLAGPVLHAGGLDLEPLFGAGYRHAQVDLDDRGGWKGVRSVLEYWSFIAGARVSSQALIPGHEVYAEALVRFPFNEELKIEALGLRDEPEVEDVYEIRAGVEILSGVSLTAGYYTSEVKAAFAFPRRVRHEIYTLGLRFRF